MLANRTLGRVLAAPRERRHYRALWNMARVYPRFVPNLYRYVAERGAYPYACAVRTPMGLHRPVLYSHHDLLTLNEVFCREDYRAGRDIRVVVDVGANIGLSGLYFLTRNRSVRCHLYEPNPENVRRLRRNLAAFDDRTTVHEAAVAPYEGTVSFGVEATGRYGAIGAARERTIRVRCREINDALAEVLERDGRIDVLKIDIEGLEAAVVDAIFPDVLGRIDRIYFESPSPVVLHRPGFVQVYDGTTCRLVNVAA